MALVGALYGLRGNAEADHFADLLTRLRSVWGRSSLNGMGALPARRC